MNTRRHFLKKVGTGSIALAALPLLNNTLVHAADMPGTAVTTSDNSSAALSANSWNLHYAGKVSRLVLKKDAGGKLTGTLAGQPISVTWNELDRSVTFIGKLDPSKSSETQIFTGVLFEISGPNKMYLAGWARSSNNAKGAANTTVSRWYAQ